MLDDMTHYVGDEGPGGHQETTPITVTPDWTELLSVV